VEAGSAQSVTIHLFVTSLMTCGRHTRLVTATSTLSKLMLRLLSVEHSEYRYCLLKLWKYNTRVYMGL